MDNIILNKLRTTYDNLKYSDIYGGSILLFVIISIAFILILTYIYSKINSQAIIADWSNQRCKLNIMPIAGLINTPSNTTAIDYTQENFNYCIQGILTNIAGDALMPLTFVTNMLSSMASQVEDDIQAVRGMFNNIRTDFQNVTQEIMGRIMNFMIPLQKIFIAIGDVMGKTQAVLVTSLFTAIGSYYSLQTFFQVFLTMLTNALIVLAVLTVSSFGLALPLFITVSVITLIVALFINDALQIPVFPAIPQVQCFDKNTLITMNDGTQKRIVDIKTGELLFGNNTVNGIMKVDSKGSTIYNLHDIIVSDSHMVRYNNNANNNNANNNNNNNNNNWIRVSEHPDAIRVKIYDEPYLYCLNTRFKEIHIEKDVFSDWDEVFEGDLTKIQKNMAETHFRLIDTFEDLHIHMDGGFAGTTKVKLQNGIYKNIQNIEVGDVLENGIQVYGVVVINGENISQQYEYNLGKDEIWEGGPNCIFSESKSATCTSTLFLPSCEKTVLSKPHKKLYHLLTNQRYFYINNIRVNDYNSCIDFFLSCAYEREDAVK